MKKQFFDTTIGFGIKLFGTMVLANVLTVVVQFVFTSIDELIGSFLSSFVCIGIGVMTYITMIYSEAWQKGFRDIGLVSRNVTTYKPSRGFAAGMIASIPSFLVYLLLVIGYFFSDQLFAVAKVIFMFLNAYPFFLINTLIESFGLGVVLCVLFIIPLPFISWMGYAWGYKNKLITKNVMYGKGASDEK